MSNAGTVSVRALRPVLAGLDAIGVETGALIREVGLGSSLLTDPDLRIPHEVMSRLWQRAIEKTGDESIGLRVAAEAPLESFDLHGYAVLSSGTPREAYRRSVRYHRLIHDSTAFRFVEERDGATIEHAFPGGLAAPRHTAEFLSLLWLRFGRLVAGRDWCPEGLTFAHRRPVDHAALREVFGCPIEYGAPGTSMRVSASVLDLRNPGADPVLTKILDRYAETLLASVPSRDSWSDRIRAEISTSLPDGVPPLGQIAATFGLSRRSLTRRLREEETTFSEIVEQERRRRAVSLLRRPDTTIGEIAFLCGFSDSASFHRAFRRWTGTTPSGYRHEAHQTLPGRVAR